MRVLVADDEVLLREGLCRLLEDVGIEVVARAGSADEALRKAGAHKPDVAILDIRMPPTHTDEGLRVAELLGERHPEMGVLVLSQYVESHYAMRLLDRRTKGIGYLLKQTVAEVDTFVSAVRRVGAAGAAVDPRVVAAALNREREHDPLAELTERERHILALMAEGRSNAGIAKLLFLSPKTVEAHVRSILMKLELPLDQEENRRVLAVLRYLDA